MFLLAIPITLLLCAGFGVSSLLSPRRAWNIPDLLGSSVLFGFASVTGLWWLLSFVCSQSALLYSATACCVVLGAIGWYRFGSFKTEGNWKWLLVYVPFWAFVIWQTLVVPIGGDGLAIWDFKARLAFAAGGRIPAAYFSAPETAWTHPTYPLAVPLFENWVYAWLGRTDQSLIKLPFLMFLAAVQSQLWSIVRRETGSTSRAGVAALLVFFVPWIILKPGGAASNWADFPLASAYLLGLGCLLELRATPASPIGRFTFAAAILPWIKQEGIVLALTLLLVLFFQKSVSLRRKSLCAALVLLTSVPWKLFLALHHAVANSDYSPVRLDTFFENATRIPIVAMRIALELVKIPFWGLLWPTALVSLWMLSRNGRTANSVSQEHSPTGRDLFICMALPIILLCSAYVFSTWSNYLNHVNTSITRVLIPPAMPALIAVGLWLPEGLFGCKSPK